MHKIVIACDSFKGSLSSIDVGMACRRAVSQVFPHCQTIVIPLGDGGEGTMMTLTAALHGEIVRCKTIDPLRRPITATYGIINNDTAVIEVASTCGLTLLTDNERNPMETSSYGVGIMIQDALNRGCGKIIVTLGGSATNDCGIGMLSALGYRFTDNNDCSVSTCGKGLSHITHIDKSNADSRLCNTAFVCACDVDCVLYGTHGAAHVFAPQKGADPKMVASLDKGLQHFSLLMAKETHRDVASLPGSGAAGGLGAAFAAFFNASLRSGIDIMLDATKFDNIIADADLIVTGEGKIDNQTVMGKVAAGVMRRAKKHGIPVIAIAGDINDVSLNKNGFDAVFSIQPAPVSLSQAMAPEFAMNNVQRTLAQQLLLLRRFGH